MNKNNEIEKTDRNEIIRRHRAVWNWIAEYLKKYDLDEKRTNSILVDHLKTEAIRQLHPEDEALLASHRNCYLCVLANNNCGTCSANEKSTDIGCLNGLYVLFALHLACMQHTSRAWHERENDRFLAEDLAREISNKWGRS